MFVMNGGLPALLIVLLKSFAMLRLLMPRTNLVGVLLGPFFLLPLFIFFLSFLTSLFNICFEVLTAVLSVLLFDQIEFFFNCFSLDQKLIFSDSPAFFGVSIFGCLELLPFDFLFYLSSFGGLLSSFFDFQFFTFPWRLVQRNFCRIVLGFPLLFINFLIIIVREVIICISRPLSLGIFADLGNRNTLSTLTFLEGAAFIIISYFKGLADRQIGQESYDHPGFYEHTCKIIIYPSFCKFYFNF